jgi:RNA polymerase sigma factor (sigma-70 family)
MNPDTPLDRFALASYAVVLSALRRRVGNHHDAEDLALEAFAAALASPEFDPTRPDAVGFVLQPASWRSAEHHRRQARAPKPLPSDLGDQRVSDPAHDLEQQEEFNEARRRFADAVDALRARHKSLFVGFYLHGTSVADLALAHGVAEQTVRGALSKAKKAVLGQLGLGRLTNGELKSLTAFAYAATTHSPAVPAAAPVRVHVTFEEPRMSTTTGGNNRDRDGNPTSAPNAPKPEKPERDTLLCRRQLLRAAIESLLRQRQETTRHDQMMCALDNRHMGYLSEEECDRRWQEFCDEFGLDE